MPIPPLLSKAKTTIMKSAQQAQRTPKPPTTVQLQRQLTAANSLLEAQLRKIERQRREIDRLRRQVDDLLGEGVG
jgi:hypothetical protein